METLGLNLRCFRYLVSKIVALTFCLILLVSCGDGKVTHFTCKILKEYKHSEKAFTQGICFEDGRLYEGTGQRGFSKVSITDFETGQIVQQRSLSDDLFGEGITVLGNRLFQLTWTSGKVFVYDKTTLKLLDTHTCNGEGWGLTHNGTDLIMSDGTDEIKFLDPDSFQVKKTIKVTDEYGKPVDEINELEFYKGEILANVWKTNKIIRINPESGVITAWIDLTTLADSVHAFREEDVLNGIAYDKKEDRLFVTGKRWPTFYEIRLIPQSN